METAQSGLQLLNEIVAASNESGHDAFASIDTFDELQSTANLVDALLRLTGEPSQSPFSPLDRVDLAVLALAGLDMLDAVSLEAFLQLVNQT